MKVDITNLNKLKNKFFSNSNPEALSGEFNGWLDRGQDCINSIVVYNSGLSTGDDYTDPTFWISILYYEA